MSYSTDRYNIEGAMIGNIALTNCGITENHPLHNSGKRIYQDYSIHFIVEGKGTFICDGKEYRLSAGEGFLILPGVPNQYIGDEREPWKYVYISFIGPGAEMLIADAGLGRDKYTFSYSMDWDALRDIYAMHKAGKNRLAKGYGVLGYLLVVMSHLVAKEKTGTSSMLSPKFYVEKAKRFIADNYMYDITVENVAAHVGIDRTYLYKLFLKYEDCAPSKHIWNIRLDMAARKLREEDLPLSEVALSSGFGDVSHFYKAFYAKYKLSPKKYRQTNCVSEREK